MYNTFLLLFFRTYSLILQQTHCPIFLHVSCVWNCSYSLSHTFLLPYFLIFLNCWNMTHTHTHNFSIWQSYLNLLLTHEINIKLILKFFILHGIFKYSYSWAKRLFLINIPSNAFKNEIHLLLSLCSLFYFLLWGKSYVFWCNMHTIILW